MAPDGEKTWVPGAHYTIVNRKGETKSFMWLGRCGRGHNVIASVEPRPSSPSKACRNINLDGLGYRVVVLADAFLRSAERIEGSKITQDQLARFKLECVREGVEFHASARMPNESQCGRESDFFVSPSNVTHASSSPSILDQSNPQGGVNQSNPQEGVLARILARVQELENVVAEHKSQRDRITSLENQLADVWDLLEVTRDDFIKHKLSHQDAPTGNSSGNKLSFRHSIKFDGLTSLELFLSSFVAGHDPEIAAREIYANLPAIMQDTKTFQRVKNSWEQIRSENSTLSYREAMMRAAKSYDATFCAGASMKPLDKMLSQKQGTLTPQEYLEAFTDAAQGVCDEQIKISTFVANANNDLFDFLVATDQHEDWGKIVNAVGRFAMRRRDNVDAIVHNINATVHQIEAVPAPGGSAGETKYCSFFDNGFCMKGANCNLVHDPARQNADRPAFKSNVSALKVGRESRKGEGKGSGAGKPL
jgi:hypothetical protein